MNHLRKHFVDSNIFVYALDARDLAKMDRARGVVNRVAQQEHGMISIQVLSETYSNLIKPTKVAMSKGDATDAIDTMVDTFEVADLTFDLVRDAMRICSESQTSYYDALLIAAANAHGASYLLTEDFQAEQLIEGVRILHVLDNDFDLSRLD